MMGGYTEADIILFGILGLCLVKNIFEIYISLRQVKVYKTANKVPAELGDHMSDETFNKARVYGLDREQFDIFKSFILDVIVIPLELYFGVISLFWQISLSIVEKLNFDVNNEILISSVFVVVIGLFGYVKELAFKIYGTFVLEERHGFNKQTPGFFVWDQIKGLIVSNILTVLLSAAIVFIVQWGGEYFFIYLWAFAGVISLVLLTIYPIFIAPLFDKYTPLEDGELRTSIEKLAASLKFPLTKLYVVEGSKRSSHSNAYFYGLWNSKRIVLFDTLLLNKGKNDDAEIKEEDKGKGCTNEEVVAVLGHELGHWKLGHVTKNIVIMQVNLLLIFIVFNYCFKYAPFYEALGFAPGVRPILVGLFIVLTYVMAPYNAILEFAMTMLSRRFEYQADEFAQKLGYAKLLQKALIKLNLDNLGFPVHDWLYSSWNHSHPTLLQRMHRLKELEAKDKKSK
uniref:CAAX prenyl protease n=1 Tax=Stomoxys calcitrans TaxID=35570 RepID=A0A1I8PJE7_STOCA